MTRKIRITLDVTLDDLSDEARAECEAAEGEVLDEEGKPIGLPRLDDYELSDLAHPVVDTLPGNESVWEGSGVFVTITGAALVSYVELPPDA